MGVLGVPRYLRDPGFPSKLGGAGGSQMTIGTGETEGFWVPLGSGSLWYPLELRDVRGSLGCWGVLSAL